MRLLCSSKRPRALIVLVFVLGILEFFVKAEAKPVLALMTYREVGEDEVTRWRRSVKIDHAGDRSSGEYSQVFLGRLHTTLRNVSSLLQSGK
jgi:hypothetical protein